MIEITARVAVHAALADPRRLAIVDALADGDLAPGELSERLGISSNLLAHHLAVLEHAHVVARRRSEGDGRRAYVSLRWDNAVAMASLTQRPATSIGRVVFVCTQNSARSQFAATLFAHLSPVPVASAGTTPAAAIHPLAAAHLRDRGLTPAAAAPRTWSDVVRDGDLVVAVCDNAYEETAGAPALHWSVPDPARRGRPRDFAEAFSAIKPRVERLAASLTKG